MTILKSKEEISKIKSAGEILGSVAKKVLEEAGVGVFLSDLDDLARLLIERAGAKPAFLGYKPQGAKKPYPASICASVNETIVHGIPGKYKLKEGDILKLDFGVYYKGYFVDAAWTLGIGRISEEGQNLIDVTREALNLALKECFAGKTLGDIGYAIGSFVRKSGFFVAEGLTGHGVGKNLHEFPNVFNEGKKGQGLKLEEGLVLAIEPMVAAYTGKIKQKEDDSFVTADGSLSAHFEHTVIVGKNGPQILTELS